MRKIIHRLIYNSTTKTFKALWNKLVGRLGRFVSMDEYALKCPDSVEYVCRYPECWLTLNRCLGSNNETYGKESFVVKLKDASCFAYSDVILLANGDYYCDIKNDEYIGYCSDCHDGNVLVSDSKLTYDIRVPSDIVEVSSAVFLSGLFSWNYYHYTYQIIPRLGMLSDVPPNVPLLADGKTIEIESFAMLMKICNIQHREVIIMQEDTCYKVRALYVCSSKTLLEPNHKPHTTHPKIGVRYSMSALKFLRDTILPYKANSNYPKRIFIGRKYVTSGRRPFNEEECIACAQEFGFEVVYPEKLSFVQQVALFANANAVIGGTGAAFTNLCYVSEGCHVIILSGYQIKSGLWEIIGNYVGAKMYSIYDHSIAYNPNNQRTLHCAFRIDTDELQNTLCEVFN